MPGHTLAWGYRRPEGHPLPGSACRNIDSNLNINILSAWVIKGLYPGSLHSNWIGGVQVKGIPFLAFDAGDVLELFDHHEYPDNIVWDPTAEGLSQRIAEVRAPRRAEHAVFLGQENMLPPSTVLFWDVLSMQSLIWQNMRLLPKVL